MGGIFINYRRGESLREAQHLATLFAKSFGAKRIFLDVRGLDGGANWLQSLERQVAASDVMVALIGKEWVDLKDEQGSRRLDSTEDFVRFEIAQALQREIPVLPVLLDGARMPKATELPTNMMPLTLFHGMPLRAESVVVDAEAIAKRIKIILAKRRKVRIPWRLAAPGAAALVAVGVAISLFGINQRLPPFAGMLPDDGRMAAELGNARARFERAEDASRKADERVVKAKQDLDRAEQDRDTLKTALATAIQERDQARSDLATINKRVLDLQKQLDTPDQARKDLTSASAKISELQKRLDVANAQILDDTERLKKLEADRDQLKAALDTALRERNQARAGIKFSKGIDCVQIGTKYDDLFVNTNKRVQDVLVEYKALAANATEQQKDVVRKKFCAFGGELVGYYKFVQAMANDCVKQGEKMDQLLEVINKQLGLAQQGIKQPCG